MTRTDMTRLSAITLASAAIAALASFTPTGASAAAADDDMDCKLILCLPAGFPSGCSDAFDHMIDRLRDGKSPIGTCSMSNGVAYEGYDISYRMKSPMSRDGWECPEGKSLYHETSDDDNSFVGRTINTFCYDTAYTRRTWTGGEGYRTVSSYTNKTPPRRTNFWVKLVLEPGTEQQYSQGWQKFDTGRGYPVRIRYTE